MKPVCIIGLGYIGLPTAVVAAQHGNTVIGYDIDATKVHHINTGDPVIVEPTLQEQLQGVIQQKTFHATTKIPATSLYIIAVPTPFKNNKQADLSYVYAALKSICGVLQSGATIIIESTIPVGATEKCAAFVAQQTSLTPGVDFFMAHCPERVLPGNIFHELITNARIIGGITQEATQRAAKFYATFVSGELYLTSATTAEMIKLIENSYRDTSIAFANQVASMATAAGLHPYEVVELANKHPRVNILQPGCGVGGHCIAVDPWFLIETFPEHSSLLQAARAVNDAKPQEVIVAVQHAVTQWRQNHTDGPIIGILGLTYKPNIDDLRESPALHIAQQLTKQFDILVCEPHIQQKTLQKYISAPQRSFNDMIKTADILLCLVQHRAFKKELIIESNKQVIDFCGITYQSKAGPSGQKKMYWSAHNVYEHATKEHC